MSTPANGSGFGFAAPPLSGVRVIEIGDYLSVGYAGSVLGDFGADVIKVELPGRIDNNRMMGGTDDLDLERSPHFAALARNKKSITLDVRTESGVKLFLRLIREADVMMENFRPGAMERWGIGPDECLRHNPELVVLRLSGFGQSGPLRDRASVDHVAQAFAGITCVTGYPETPPVRTGIPIADCASGLVGAFGILLALLARQRGDRGGRSGQVIDVALYEPFLPMLAAHSARYRRYGEIRERMGNTWAGVSPGGCYECRDGRWVAIDATGDVPFGRLARTIGRSEWLSDPRLATRRQRYEHRNELEETLRSWVADKPASDVVRLLTDTGVGAAQVNSIKELVHDPHVLARGGFVDFADPTYGSVLMPAPVPKMGQTPGAIRTPAPRLGEHNDEIYRQVLGLSEDEIEEQRQLGAI